MDLISPKVAYASVDSFIASVNTQIINPLILLLFALALAYFLYGLFIFIANGANDEKKTTGKEHMFWGVIGLTVMMGVWFLLDLVLATLNIPTQQINPKEGKVDLPD
jgi:cell division protein FtsW (lipid II flippase)